MNSATLHCLKLCLARKQVYWAAVAHPSVRSALMGSIQLPCMVVLQASKTQELKDAVREELRESIASTFTSSAIVQLVSSRTMLLRTVSKEVLLFTRLTRQLLKAMYYTTSAEQEFTLKMAMRCTTISSTTWLFVLILLMIVFYLDAPFLEQAIVSPTRRITNLAFSVEQILTLFKEIACPTISMGCSFLTKEVDVVTAKTKSVKLVPNLVE
mmetsp:Transcript_7105/g.10900  ORF Transcript_7105/g.10900 Transcript_7105/m.10900 type:complete len:212 (+) Transcript_7105:263-898(+)